MAAITNISCGNSHKHRLYGEDLPQELWIEIFFRSSVESLIRIKCVCTRWHALVSNPSFNKKHLQLQKAWVRTTRVASSLRTTQTTVHRDCYLYDVDSVIGATTSSDRNPFHSLSHNGGIIPLKTIDGSINGLYCVCNGRGRAVIWNPATKEVGLLPFPEECLACDSESSSICYISEGVIGFGIDPLNEEDYKVVFICSYETEDDDRGYCRMLYTTNTNTWTFVEDKFLLASECPDDYPSKNVFSKGIYYWLPQSEFGSIALAFDMGSESFKQIPTPDIDTENQCGELALQNDDVTLFIVDEDLSQINIWVLIVDESIWTKKNSISRIQGVRKSLGFWRKEEELFLVIDHSRGTQASDGQTVLYNSTSGEIRNIGPKGWVECFEALVYYESLGSLSGGITKMKANHAMICYWLNTDSRDEAERN